MKKILALLILALSLTFPLVACRDNTKETDIADNTDIAVLENTEKATKDIESTENIDTSPYDKMPIEEKNENLIDAVKALIKSVVDINAIDRNGESTALMAASYSVYYYDPANDDSAGGESLGDESADGESLGDGTSSNGTLPNKYLDVVKYLVENGADVNTQSQYGRTALVSSMQHGGQSPEVVTYLIDSGANIAPIFEYNYDYNGNTA